MKRFSCLCLMLGLTLVSWGFDTQGLVPVARVVGAQMTDKGLRLSCADGSVVQLGFLAPDIVRVLTVFAGQDAGQDQSWAVARTDWPAVKTEFSEQADSLSLCSDLVEVRVQREPLLVSFIDRKSGRVLNRDDRPVARDASTGRIAVFKHLGVEEHFYGLGERAAHLDRRRTEFAMWNSDTPAYVEGIDPIYQSIPFYIGLEQGQAYGLFHDNSFKAKVDFGRNGQEFAGFCAEGGFANYYFFAGPSIRHIVSRYTELTGRMQMPPLWSMGHHQSRFSYYPESVVEDIVSTYRAHDLPLDAMYLDIHYMDGYRSFTFDAHRFPDPKALSTRLAAKGVRLVTIIDPGIKYQPHPEGEKGYSVFDEGVAGNHFLKRKSGQLYIGEVWPGKAVFSDYTREETRRWWGGLYGRLLDVGVAGFWNDMNEPSDFVDKTGDTQADVLFEDGGRRSSYLENRNLFALLMARATFEGLSRLQTDVRPFIITRAGYAGIQRYAVTWTGDCPTTWENLHLSLSMFQSMGLSGQPFVGADIPGFMGRADGELLVRSYQIACFTPLFRNHAAIDDNDREPWRFGPQYEAIVRKYIKLRYQLLPYLYTGIEEAHRTGLPVFRPLVMNFQEDPGVATLDDQFMVGDALLAAPVLRAGERSREVYLPEGVWYDFWTGLRLDQNGFRRFEAPLDHLLLFVRGGSVLPSTQPMSHVHEKPWSPLSFDLYPDAAGHAEGSLYEDDGASNQYQKGQFRRTHVSVSHADSATRVVLASEGSYVTPARLLVFTLHSAGNVSAVLLDGKVLPRSSASVEMGWQPGRGDSTSVRIQDDGHSHELILR